MAKRPTRYSGDDKIALINAICEDIESGLSVRKSLDTRKVRYRSFFDWIAEDETIRQQYARACEIRIEKMADEILAISDATAEDIITDADGNTVINHNVIARDKLRVDSRKWLLSKMNPKKYGNQLDVTTDGDKIGTSVINVIAHEGDKE